MPSTQVRLPICKAVSVLSSIQPLRNALLKPLTSWLWEMPAVNSDRLRLMRPLMRAGSRPGRKRNRNITTASSRKP